MSKKDVWLALQVHPMIDKMHLPCLSCTQARQGAAVVVIASQSRLLHLIASYQSLDGAVAPTRHPFCSLFDPKHFSFMCFERSYQRCRPYPAEKNVPLPKKIVTLMEISLSDWELLVNSSDLSLRLSHIQEQNRSSSP